MMGTQPPLTEQLTFKRILSITKPGIIFGNTVTLCGGFFLASTQGIAWLTLLITIVGMALVIACGCIINNIIDQDIDRLMERTRNRILVQKQVSQGWAALCGIVAGIAGMAVLYYLVNPLTASMALVGLVIYVAFYTLWLKRRSIHGTAMGGIAGAMPPVVGYCAVANHLDWGALAVFLILFFWQMPHFFAIAIYRLSDYSAACIPVLPAIKGTRYTKVSMLLYLILFFVVSLLPTILGYTGYIYAAIAALLSLRWLYITIRGMRAEDERAWARRVFLFSIIVITVLSLAMAIKI